MNRTGTGKGSGNRPQGKPSVKGPKHRGRDFDLKPVIATLDREVEKRLLAMSEELKKLVREEVREQATRLSQQEEAPAQEAATAPPVDVAAIRAEIRSEVEAKLRIEMEDRLTSISKQRAVLEPQLVLRRFSEAVARRLKQAGRADDAQLNEQFPTILRQSVLDAFRSRKQHLSHLSKIDYLVQNGELDQLPDLLDELFVEAGLRKVTQAGDTSHFLAAEHVIGEENRTEVITPAYVDDVTGQTIRSGRLRHVSVEQESHSESEETNAGGGAE